MIDAAPMTRIIWDWSHILKIWGWISPYGEF